MLLNSTNVGCSVTTTRLRYVNGSESSCCHDYPTSIPSRPLCFASTKYSLFIRRYSSSATEIILSQNNWSLLSLFFNLSLEPTPFISSSTSFWCQFLHFLFTYSLPISSSFDSPLLIHNSLSFPPGLKPTCFINPFPRSFTSSRTAFMGYCPDCFFWATPMPTRFLV